MNIMDKDSISNMISIYNKVLDEKYTDKTTLYFQDSGIFDFNTYPKYLYISSSEPFDKYFWNIILVNQIIYFHGILFSY